MTKLLMAEEVAAMLGVPKSWIYEQSRKGTIPTVELGRYRRYDPASIERWIRDREAGSVGTDNINGAAPHERPAPDTTKRGRDAFSA